MASAAGDVPDAWRTAITAWATHMRAGGSPATTISTRADHLCRLARHGGIDSPWRVTGADLVAWFGQQTWATETRRGVRNSLLGFYRWAIYAGHTRGNPAEELPRVKPAAPSPRPIPRAAYAQAYTAASARTRLILRLAAEAGLRRAEIACVHRNDLTSEADGWSLLVHGKGRKTRIVPLTDGLAMSLIDAADGGYVFPGDDGGHLSPRYVGKLARQVLPDQWTLHTLRHSFATRAYALERDVFAVQDLLGHASPTTTRNYVQMPAEAKRRHVEALGHEEVA